MIVVTMPFINQYTKINTIILLYIYLPYSVIRVVFYLLDIVKGRFMDPPVEIWSDESTSFINFVPYYFCKIMYCHAKQSMLPYIQYYV